MESKYYKLLVDFRKLPAIEYLPTFLEISRFPHYENVIRNWLSFFLQSSNPHKFNGLFLYAMLKEFNHNISLEECMRMKVNCSSEVYTDSGNRIDLLVETQDRIIVIEHKINHYLNNNLTDYSKFVKINNEGKEIIEVVLSLRETEVPIGNHSFKNLTYKIFFRHLESVLGYFASTASSHYTLLLMDFIKTIKNQYMNQLPNQEAINFFRKHSQDIFDLYEQHERYISFRQQNTETLKQIISDLGLTQASQIATWNNDIKIGACVYINWNLNKKDTIAIDIWQYDEDWKVLLFVRNDNSKSVLNGFLENIKEIFDIKALNLETESGKYILQKYSFEEKPEQIAGYIGDYLLRFDNFIAKIKQENNSES